MCLASFILQNALSGLICVTENGNAFYSKIEYYSLFTFQSSCLL